MKIESPKYRIVMATIILVFSMVVTILDGFAFFSVNDGIVITMIGFASGLLSIGIIKNYKKGGENE